MTIRRGGFARELATIAARGIAVVIVVGAVCAWRVHPGTWSRDELVAWWERESDERSADTKLSYLVESLERRGDREGAGALMARAMTADLRLGAGERFERRLAAHGDALALSSQHGQHLQSWIEEALTIGDVERAERLWARLESLDATTWGGIRERTAREIRLTRMLVETQEQIGAGRSIDGTDPLWSELSRYVEDVPKSTPDVRNGYFTRAGLARRSMLLFAALAKSQPGLVRPYEPFIREWTDINPDDPVSAEITAAWSITSP
ncbi:MAG: hypothetical protein KJ042_02895 [Deltaproteobacteria bacterium]|nr:hypothetical protein [Deltaproteobacteria bacterium]